MLLTITRFKNIYDGTIGKFELSDSNTLLLTGYTLEPAGNDTIQSGQDRRIPEGLYNVKWIMSPRFGKVYATLYNDQVSENRRILIHPGNYPKDTEGCILLGANYNDTGVFQSKDTIAKFHSFALNKPLNVKIINAFNK